MTGLRAALLLVLPGLVAWTTGRPFLFPSLGPTAYSLVGGRGRRLAARVVIAGHFWGVAAGMAAYHFLAGGLVIGAAGVPGSYALLRLSAAGVLSVAATIAAMEATGTSHSPACATTLIVSLGLLPTLADAGIILASVALMVAVNAVLPEEKKHRAEKGDGHGFM